MLVWFTSDPHFSCPNTLRREHRPFKNVEDYDSYVVDLWNSQVKRKDIIYVIGDFVSCDDSWRDGLNVVKRIKARVVLVVGNNEHKVVKTMFDGNYTQFNNYCRRVGFVDVRYYAYVRVDKYEVYLTHEPRNHNLAHITLFGHVHKGVGVYKPCGFNMFLDLNYFRLYSADDVLDLIDTRNKYWKYSPNVADNAKPKEEVFI